MMENMGLRVITEHPYQLRIDDGVTFLQDFEVEATREFDIAATGSAFEDAFLQVWRGNAENDGFNRLVLGAGLTWRQVAMLRGYCKFLLQVGVPFSQSYVEETFSRYPLLARLLVELFEARFDPRREKPGTAELTEGRERFAGQLGMLCGDDAEALKALRPLIDARAKGRDVPYPAAPAGLTGPHDRVPSLHAAPIMPSSMGVIETPHRPPP